MTEIIGIVLVILGIAYVIGDFESIKEAIMYCLVITIAVTLAAAVGCYLKEAIEALMG